MSIKMISEEVPQTSLDINALTDKATPVNADITVIEDSADTFAKKKLSWLNIKATLKTYFDTLYTGGTFDIHALTDKPTPVNADETVITDSATSFTNKKLTFTNLKAFLKTYFDTLYPAETTTSEGALINSATAKTTPVDADYVGLMDSAASNVLKKLSWANIKATAKTYFDTLYVALTSKDATGGYAGLTLFKINFKNAANTFTSFFTNSNTAARTYTFQDRDGTIIDTTNIVTGATDNVLLRSDGTGGATLQNTNIVVDDSNVVTINTTGSFPQLTLSKPTNTPNGFRVSNTNSGTNSSAQFDCYHSTSIYLVFYMFTPAYSTSGRYAASSALIEVNGSGGLGISTIHASASIKFYTANSSTAKMELVAGGGLGIGGTPNANAILDLTSTTKAFMPPRCTTTQKGAIGTPTAGMVVYDSTLNKLSVYTGAAWETVTSV